MVNSEFLTLTQRIAVPLYKAIGPAISDLQRVFFSSQSKKFSNLTQFHTTPFSEHPHLEWCIPLFISHHSSSFTLHKVVRISTIQPDKRVSFHKSGANIFTISPWVEHFSTGFMAISIIWTRTRNYNLYILSATKKMLFS